ncbi:hypothetical protein KEM54_004372 [Ascosphaera aggregata]|nr:hypothetical protein KEM54_004372 [Ascosphaera aggregata]
MAFLVMGSMFWALIWLLYRAYLVFQTPNDLLVEKLGLDIPPAPEVTLEEISSRSIRVAWKHSDPHNSINKHLVQVNGVKVAETRRSQTAAEISNLLPGRIYHICIIAVSAANFHTSSPLLHVRTKPQSSFGSRDSRPSNASASATTNAHTSGHDEEHVLDDLPIVRPYTPIASPQSTPVSAPSLSKDSGATHPSFKRGPGGRKSTQSSVNLAAEFSTSEESQGNTADDDGDTDLPGWSARLLSLQNEMDALQDQLEREAREHNALVLELEERRDELKKQVKEKDEISSDLKRQVNKLEAQNRTVQNEKSKHERILQQRDVERAKRREDVERWNAKLARMEEELQQLKDQRGRIEDKTKSRISELREKVTREQNDMKSLDEEIKTKGGRIKKMEEERRRLEGDDSEENRELDQLERERDSMWERKLANLRSHYTSLIAVFTQAQAQYHEAQEHLKWVSSQRATAPIPLPSVPALDLDVQRTPVSSMRNRHGGSFASNSSPLAFPLPDSNPIYNPTFGNSPTFSGTNYLTYTGGLPLKDRLNAPLERNNVDHLSQDPPLSPRADALLPSGLLGDEDHTEPPGLDSPTPRYTTTARLPLDSLLNNSPSPVSSGSRPASRFVSPRHSSSNLRETTISSSGDPMAPPVSQTTDGTAESTSHRLSAFFGFHRQRGKTLGEGPPQLGTLDKAQSNSFPKSEQDLDPIGTRRRRRSHTDNWPSPLTGLFPRSQAAAGVSDTSSDHTPLSYSTGSNNVSSKSQLGTPTRKPGVFSSLFPASRFFNKHEPAHERGYNQFSPRHDPIDPSILVRGDSSPRPSSTYSREKTFPEPGSDNTLFGWPVQEKASSRVSPLGADWSSPASWSRSQSRRPSIQLGSATHLPLLPTTDGEFVQGSPLPVQAPIGTRPTSSNQRPSTPKLNPAAPSFKTIFSKKLERVRSKDSSQAKNNDNDDEDSNAVDNSPVSRRGSHSTKSTQVSIADSNDSLEPAMSISASESSAKETFMQKLSRKSSGSKFSISWKDRPSLFSKKDNSSSSEKLPQSEAEDDNDGAGEAGEAAESNTSAGSATGERSSKGSSFFKRKSRKASSVTKSLEENVDSDKIIVDVA